MSCESCCSGDKPSIAKVAASGSALAGALALLPGSALAAGRPAICDGQLDPYKGFGGRALSVRDQVVSAREDGRQRRWLTQYQGSGTFRFLLDDITSGQSDAITVSGAPYDGSSAEYIAERPTNGSTHSLYDLAAFGTFSEALSLTNGIEAQKLPNVQIQMESTDLSDNLALTGGTGAAGAFNVQWENCH